MRNRAISAVKPRTSLLPASPYIYYRMHEGTSDQLVDAAGNGPDLTVEGTLTNVWDNPEWLTLSGDNYCQSGADDVIDAMFRLDDIGSGALFLTYDYWHDGDVTGGEAYFTWGSTGGNYPDNQGWGCNLTNDEQVQMVVRGSSTTNTTNFPGSGMGSLGSQRNTLTWEILGDGTVNLYMNGALAGGISATEFSGVQQSLTGGTATGLTLFARNQSSGQDRFLSSAAGNARAARFFACKIPAWVSGDGLKVNRQMYYGKGEIPVVLAGR